MLSLLQKHFGHPFICMWHKHHYRCTHLVLDNYLCRVPSGLQDESSLPVILGCMCVPERANFPTDLYMLEGLIRQLGNRHELRLVEHHDDIAASITDDVVVLVLTHVSYRTGRMLDMARYTRLAHQAYAPSQRLPPHHHIFCSKGRVRCPPIYDCSRLPSRAHCVQDL